MPTRIGCVRVADWAVVAARARDPALVGVPVVVHVRVDGRDVVRAACPQARAAGVVTGLRRREAEARVPGLVCVAGDEADEVRAFEPVVRAIERFTPRVEMEQAGRCEFPARGPSRYFGGDEALAVALGAAVAEVLGPDITVRVGIADGAFAARLAARRGDRGEVVPPGGSAAFLAPWPVAALGDPALADLLVRLGVPTLGDLAALPAGSVLDRFGAPGRLAHDLASGREPAPPSFATPPPDLVERTELDPPADRIDAAAFAARALAERLDDRLARIGLVCTRVLVEAETEHGERLARGWRLADDAGPGALAERVRRQLEAWVGDGGTSGGLTLLRLVPEEVAPVGGRRLGLWGDDPAGRDRADRAFARVQSLLGPEAVVTAVLQGGRTPVERVRWVPWGDERATERRGQIDAWPGALPAPAPARVLDPPDPAELLDDTGAPVVVGGRGEHVRAPARLESALVAGAVVAWAGPWAHDVRWWDRAARRRTARYQLVVRTHRDGDVACVVAVAGGRAALEAVHD
ncbi:MAG: DNA polymerase Y family protein [Actinomycetota bacterium]